MECQRGQNCQTTKIIVKWSRHSQTNIISILKLSIFHKPKIQLKQNWEGGKHGNRKARKWERKMNNLARSSLISSLCSGSPTLHPRRF